MATFKVQIEDMVGSVGDDTALTSWLTDGAKEIINFMPEPELSLVSAQQTFTSAAVGSEAETLNTGKILHVFRNDGDIDQPCRPIQALFKGRASDPYDMQYASITDPVFYIENNKLNALPDGGSCKYSEVQYPSVAHGDSAISVFPDEYEYLVVLYGAIKGLQRRMSDKLGNSSISTALSAIATELGEAPAVCDKVDADLVLAKAEVVLAKAEAAELATQTDNGGDFETAVDAMATELAKVDNVIVEASAEFDKVDNVIVEGSTEFDKVDNVIIEGSTEIDKSSALLDLGETDSEGAVNTAAAKIITEMDETQAVCDKIDADLVLAKAEIVLAKAEAAELASNTDNSSNFETACDAMVTELDKVDEIISLANDEFDEVSTQVSGSKDSPITDAFTEFEEAKNLSGAYGSGDIRTSLDAMQASIDEVDNIVDVAKGKVTDFYTSIGDIDDTTEVWDSTNKRFTVIRDALLQAEKLIDSNEPHADYDVEANLADVDAAYAKMSDQLDDAETVLGANSTSSSINTALAAMATQAGQSVQALANMGVEIGLANQEVDDALTEIGEAISLTDSSSSDIKTAVDGMKTANAKFRADGGDPALFGDESTYNTSNSAMTSVKTYVDRAISYINGNHPDAAYDLTANLADIDAELTSEDIELANGRMQQAQSTINAAKTDLEIAQMYITEWNTMADTLVKEVNAFASEAGGRFGWIKAKADVWQAELSAAKGYIETANGYLSQANGFNSTVQAYGNEVQARISYSDSYMKASRSRKEEGDARVSQLNATVSVASQELARANVAIAEINTIMSSYKLEIEGVSPYLQSAQGYISQAQGYAGEIQSYSVAGQIFINTGKAYLEEAQATIGAGNAYLQEAQGRIAQANGYAAEVNARASFSGAKARSIEGYISTAQAYVSSAQGFGNEVQAKIAIANGYISEINVRLKQAEAKRQESQARLTAGGSYLQEANAIIGQGNAYLQEANSIISQGNAYISEAQAYISQAQGYASEVNARAGFSSAKAQAIQGYVNTAQSYVATAQGFGNEVQAKIAISQGYSNEVQTRLAVDTKEYEWLMGQQAKLQADYDKGLQVVAKGMA